jgi:serine phosphatase RsbU (regulator of sigma subunit)
VNTIAETIEARINDVGRGIGRLGQKAEEFGRTAAAGEVGTRLKNPPLIDPIRYKNILINLLKLLVVFELLSAFGEGLKTSKWLRFGTDMILAGLLFIMWERIAGKIRERKAIARQKIETEPYNIPIWDAFLFSLLWSDEILRDIPKDRNRFVVISYTLIAIAVVASFLQLGSGLMPLVVAGALVMAAVNLLIWVVSLERGERETLQTELRLARDVQISLMPKTHPSLQGFEISGISVPAREVGGDLFEYSAVGNDNSRFGIAVSDVSGKGLQAALAAVFTSGAFATEVRRSSSPAEILASMNWAVFSHSRRGQFVAFLLAVLDVPGKTMTFANAGQTKPLLVSSGRAEWLDAVGIHFPLGMQAESGFDERTISLAQGDILFLLTDGFTDAMNNLQEGFGQERIEQFVVRPDLAHRSAREIVEDLTSEVQKHAGAMPQHDDMTLVVVKVL